MKIILLYTILKGDIMNLRLIKNLEKIGEAISYSNKSGKVEVLAWNLGAVIYWIKECNWEVVNIESKRVDGNPMTVISFAESI